MSTGATQDPGSAAPTTADRDRIATRPLKPDDWPVVERLFGERGGCGGCWCMWWRMASGGKQWEAVKGEPNRRRLQEMVSSGTIHAVLAFAADEPVGWCCFGPRSSFPRIERVKALRRETSERTWSIVCFYVPAPWRRRGVANRLLGAATERAFALGASEVEGYPVAPKKNPDRVPPSFAWTGVRSLFRAAGYRELARPPAYHRLWLTD